MTEGYKEAEIGLIPENWNVEELNFFVELLTYGFTNPMPSVVNGPYLITAKNVNNGKILYSECRRTTHEAFNNLLTDKSKPKLNDILVTKDGTLGRIGLVDKDNCCINQSVALLRTNDRIVPKFLKYLLESPFYQAKMKLDARGTTIQHIQITVLKKMEIAVPPLSEQKEIVEIIAKLDDKINLNDQMNQTLESIGQAIFKHWFVDFEFPDENGNPYKSSGGEMIDSDLGEIPKGWKVSNLKDFGKVICGKTPPKSRHEYFNGKVPFIKIPDMHGQTFVVKTEDTLSEEGKDFQANKTIPPKSICVSCIATVGLVCINDKESQTNQQINSIIPNYDYLTPFLYFKLSSMKDFLKILASGGSATLNLNTKNFSNIKIANPESFIMKNYYNLINHLFEAILINSQENKYLSKIRDSLLPKLMSGKIRVNIPEEATAK